MKKSQIVRYTNIATRVEGDQPPPPAPTPPPQDDAAAQAKYAADLAKAEADKLKKQLAELQAQLPTPEERAKWAQMEAEAQKAEEDRLAKAGQFDQWRQQINEKHNKELAEREQSIANARAMAEAIEKELNDSMIGREFANATEWFGPPPAKTVWFPEVAQSYFAKNVSVEVLRDDHGHVTHRNVVVKDNRGVVIVDPKTGKPASFSVAIGHLIDNHPQKQAILRGSGKVGSGSAGGGTGADTIDLTRLRPADFLNPEVRDRVKQHQNVAGGLQIGPGFDRLNKAKNKS